jgi:hypothetical protein
VQQKNEPGLLRSSGRKKYYWKGNSKKVSRPLGRKIFLLKLYKITGHE